MKTDVAGEVAACLKSAPGGDAGTNQVYDWLFTLRNCVAVRLCRILEDEAARELVTEAAARTWRQCVETEGEPQRLWQDLRGSFARIAAEEDRASVRAGPFPHDQAVGLLPTTLLDGTRTVRALATECRGFCDAPLVTCSDLICPYPQLSMPYYAAARQWQDTPQAVRVFCNVQQVPIGDFIPASIVLRLRLMTELRGVLRSEWTKCVAIDDEYRSFVERANRVHSELWAAQDAEERSAMMALLQVYLAGGKPALIVGLMGYEADWAVLPADVPTLIDRCQDRPLGIYDHLEALGLPPTFGERRGRLVYSIQEALKNRPGDVARIVKGGLEWLLKVLCKVSKRPKCRCGGLLRPDEQSPNVLICAECGKQYADRSKRGPASSKGQSTYEERQRQQLHPDDWAIDILDAIDKLAKRPGATGLFHEHMRAVAASLVQEREAKEAGAPWPRQRPKGSPGWLLTHCPKSLRGPANAPLPPWKYFVLASFHNGICEGQGIPLILPSGWPAISLEGPNMPSEYPGKAPESAPDDSSASRLRAFFASPEYQEWAEYDRYADRPVGEWERDKATLTRYVEEVAADLNGCLQAGTRRTPDGRPADAQPGDGGNKRRETKPKSWKRSLVSNWVRQELPKRVKAAKDHAHNLKDLGETPKLLPRPTQQELAIQAGKDLGMSVSETMMSHILEDKGLRATYEGLGDLDTVMGRDSRAGVRLCPSCGERHSYRCDDDDCTSPNDNHCETCHKEVVHGDVAPQEEIIAE